MAKVKVTREQKKLLKAIKKNPGDPAPLVLLGWSFFQEHRYSEAKEYFVQALDIGPASMAASDANYGLALMNLKNEEYEQARDRLRSIIRETPGFQKRPDVHFALARTNDLLWRKTSWASEKEKSASEFLRRAFDHYEQALERRAERQEAASFFLGKLFCDTGQFEEALPYLQRASSGQTLTNQERFDANALLGRFFLESKHEMSEAKVYLEAALRNGAAPGRLAELYRQLGVIAQAEQDDDLAMQRYEQALSSSPQELSEPVAEMLINLSELKFRHHWVKVAIDHAERALQAAEESSGVVLRAVKVLAESYQKLKEYEKASEYEQQYFKATKDPRQKAQSLLRLGANYEQLEQVKPAIDAYRKGLKFAKGNLESSKLYGALGRMYLRENRLNQAVNQLKHAVDLATDDAEHTAAMYRLLGECYAQRGENERAIEAYGTIIAKHADSAEEPFARQELKNFRKTFKKDMQEAERAQMAEDFDPTKFKGPDEQERLVELIDELLDEKGFFERLKEGLAKTHMNFVAKLEDLLANRTSVDDELIENLEEALILSDIGVATTQRIIENLQDSVERKELKDPSQVKYYLQREVQTILSTSEKKLDLDREKPFVILVIGVNGTGKTTTIGKLASKFKAQGKEVLLVAGDTFRAAAIEQLEIWGDRTGCEVIKHASGADPSAVMYDAIHAAQSRAVDVVIADTAGRLHTKKNLMEELKKMVRVISREMPGAPHEILMVIDATTGQNAISQAKLFHEGVGLSGLVLTKLDGTAKGGIIVGIANDLNLPVTYIGIGEQVEDLREFQAKEFVDALFED